jgi:response regulator RpfG family c-di-GMP phosphodiesterase
VVFLAPVARRSIERLSNSYLFGIWSAKIPTTFEYGFSRKLTRVLKPATNFITSILVTMYRKRVIHLDDQYLLSTVIRESAKKEFYKLYFLSFHDVNEALQYISNAIEQKEEINLIITDLNHTGLNGYGFAKQIRKIERTVGIRTPILLLTTVLDDHPLVKEGLEKKIFDYYLHKSANIEDISAIIHETFRNQ